MTELKSQEITLLSRRRFCRSALGVAAMIPFSKSSLNAAEMQKKVKFYKNLGGGHIGVRANQQQALVYAQKYGFDSITPSVGEFENKSPLEIREWKERMEEKGIRYGASGLPVEFRRDEKRFQKDLARFPKQASVLRQLGVKRMATWILPEASGCRPMASIAEPTARPSPIPLPSAAIPRPTGRPHASIA